MSYTWKISSESLILGKYHQNLNEKLERVERLGEGVQEGKRWQFQFFANDFWQLGAVGWAGAKDFSPVIVVVGGWRQRRAGEGWLKEEKNISSSGSPSPIRSRPSSSSSFSSYSSESLNE